MDWMYKVFHHKCHNTPLHGAVMRNESVEVVELLKSGADVDASNSSGERPLDLSIFNNNVTIVKMLIQHGASVNYINNHHKITPLHRAVYMNKSVEIVKILLKNGAEVNVRDLRSEAPLDLAVSNNNLAIVKLLIEYKAFINDTDQYLRTPLHRAAVTDKATEIVELLIASGARLQTWDFYAKTPLHLAVAKNNVNIARILIKHGTPVDVKFCKTEVTPLLYTVESNNKAVEAVEFLIENGANVNAKDFYNQTPLHFAVCDNLPVVRLLIEHGASLNCKGGDNRQTPLHYVIVNNGAAEIAELLLANSADVNAKDCVRRRPLHRLCERRLLDENGKRLLELLLKNGALVNARGYRKETALFYAFSRLSYVSDNNNDSDCFIIENLLKYGANPNDSEVRRLALSALKYIKQSIRFFQQYLVKMNVARLLLHEDYKPYIDELGNQNYNDECLKEVEKLKSFFIDNRKSLYNFLSMHPTPRGAYINHEKVQQLVETQDLMEKFPKYSDIILASYREAVTRKSLLKPAKAAFYEIIRARLIDSIDQILVYLSDADLINIIESTQQKPSKL